ncbi:hypothetical protein ACIQRW_32165 [Streptomyces sp. NPDC091287]|uniref:hypothetical protein n=1 Tax=Streptomyces sp. NPDC091287 TaxID=3365988 RepID=UPI00380035D7
MQASNHLWEHGEAEGWWHWEEGCVTSARRATATTWLPCWHCHYLAAVLALIVSL